ncbi:MAG: YlbF family regulator [Acidaminococcus sp.]|jgi:cell fate (sporulation/competence/biofilm development) regulator YlbF (YheA/YmcA/DUF963 family)|nr:YlbF family regulator [Acidaminococcus sp.]MCI2115958.1 YlbF family regulator [Acidaminococcus sp.]
MNVYDEMTKLCEGIRDTHEFKMVHEAKEKLQKDKDAESMVKEYINLQTDIQMAQYQGKKPEPEKVEKVNKLMDVLKLNPVAMDYLQNFMHFQMMIAELTKTYQDTIKEAIE